MRSRPWCIRSIGARVTCVPSSDAADGSDTQFIIARRSNVIVTTMNDIPGYDVEEVFGEVFGLTVRSRNIGSQIGARLKSILGGELKGMTTALVDSREQVMQRMSDEAEKKGGNAIIAMRFDTSEMGPNWTEICAYGTAVRVRKR